MFERYTERARRVLFFSRYEATLFGAASIEPEHLLLGLIREGKGGTSRVFAHARIGLEGLRAAVERHLPAARPPARVSSTHEMPFSAAMKQVLAHAADEADRLAHSHIGTEHLLLALVGSEGTAGAILRERGLVLDAVRADVSQWRLERSSSDDSLGRPHVVAGSTPFEIAMSCVGAPRALLASLWNVQQSDVELCELPDDQRPFVATVTAQAGEPTRLSDLGERLRAEVQPSSVSPSSCGTDG